jgi:hypothetical protein
MGEPGPSYVSTSMADQSSRLSGMGGNSNVVRNFMDDNPSVVPAQFRGKAPESPVQRGMRDDTGAWFLEGDKPVYANASRESLDSLFGPEYAKRFDAFRRVESVDADGNRATYWLKPNLSADQIEHVNALGRFHRTFSPTKATPEQKLQHDRLQGLAYGYDPAKVDSYVANRAAEFSGLPSHSVEAGSKPIRGYHGSNRAFDKFRESDTGGNFADLDVNVPPDGVWFAAEPDRAAGFARYATRSAERNGQDPGAEAIYPADLNFKNPYTHSAEMFADEGISSLPSLDELRALGHDGVIVPRGRWTDYPNMTIEGTDYAAIQPGTVKSPYDGSILFSNAPDAAPAGVLAMDAASRMERARAMGFDTEKTWYRGATHDVGPELDRGAWVTDSPDYASAIAMGLEDNSPVTAPNVTPVYVRGRPSHYGRDMDDGTQSRTYSPTDIRSVNAAFDPAQSSSANLLAVNPRDAAPAGLLATGEGEHHSRAQPRNPSGQFVTPDSFDGRLSKFQKLVDTDGDGVPDTPVPANAMAAMRGAR